MSTTGGGSASFTPGSGMTYATPYAFKRPKKKQKAIPENIRLNQEAMHKESTNQQKIFK